MSGPDVHGPIDFVVVEFPGDATGAATAQALVDLVDRATVRLYDLVVVRKADNGTWTEVELDAASDGQLGELRAFAGARSGLLGDEDLADVADVLDPGTLGAVLVYENAWAIPFVAAARSEGAELVAGARLTAQQIMDALDAAEAAD